MRPCQCPSLRGGPHTPLGVPVPPLPPRCHHVPPLPTQNNIPVLSPALTDGSLGDMIFFHSYKHPGLVLDIVEGEFVPMVGGGHRQQDPPPVTAVPPPTDLRLINTRAIFARKTGMIILGGGLVKHHIANANLMVRGWGGAVGTAGWGAGGGREGMETFSLHSAPPSPQRNGADFSVYVNTAQEFDGSDSGAQPDEAVSWGKIRMDATPVKVGVWGGGFGVGGDDTHGGLSPFSCCRSMLMPRWFFRCWWRRRLHRELLTSPCRQRETELSVGGGTPPGGG